MNYLEARVYLDEMSKYGSVLGLDNMKELLDRLNNPQKDLKFIHISGTNGKGSCLAYLSSVLTGAGYRIGRYVSPTLFSYRERIQVNGEEIEKDSLASHVTAIAEAIDGMLADGLTSPTIFEVETALSFLYFKEKQCDIVVLETGLGGRLDATNVIETTILEVITSISMDHMDFLGDTLGKIAAEKAGIIKPDTKVVSAYQMSEAAAVLRETCEKQNAEISFVNPDEISDVHYGLATQTFSYKGWHDVKISLSGSYQVKNAALALEGVEALRSLGFKLSDEEVYSGMANANWKGRFTLLSESPAVIIDGAHNPAAAEELVRSLKLYFNDKKLYYVFGVFKDKDYEKIIELTAPPATKIYTVETPGNPRALSAEALKEAVVKVNPNSEAAASITDAVTSAINNAGSDGAVIIFGSLSFLSEAEDAVNKWKFGGINRG